MGILFRDLNSGKPEMFRQLCSAEVHVQVIRDCTYLQQSTKLSHIVKKELTPIIESRFRADHH